MIIDALIATVGLALLVAVALVDGTGKVDNAKPAIDIVLVVVLSFLACIGFYALAGLSGG